VRFESQEGAPNPFAPREMPYGGARSYHLGAYVAARSADGTARTLATASAGTNGDTLATLDRHWSSAWLTRLALWARPTGEVFHSACARFSGSDFVAEARLANADRLVASYHQRLAPSGPLARVTAGGELLLDRELLGRIAGNPATLASGDHDRPLAWSAAATLAAGLNRWIAGLYLPHAGALCVQLGLESRVTEHATLVAKADVHTRLGGAGGKVDVFAGYKLRFPRSRSIFTASVDSDAKAKLVFERRLLSNVRFAVSGTVQKAPRVIPGQGPEPGEASKFGFHLKIGTTPSEPLSLSPCLLRNHAIFHR
jgi:hypothetical protein